MPSSFLWRLSHVVPVLFFLATLIVVLASRAYAQSDIQPRLGQEASASAVDPKVLAELAQAAKEKPAAMELAPAAGLDFLSLLFKGGWFMVPIAMVSVMAFTLIIERSFGLRRGQLLPRRLVKSLGRLARDSESVDPRTMNTVCLEHPSSASKVIRSMLLKVGRPTSEMQASATEVLQREAEKAHASVRWLNFAAAVGPLLGLLGTVWGLIQAFHDMTQLSPTQNRAEYLGRGIYEALVTTLAGLIVAIPAALFAHYFEGRITKIFGEIEEILFALIPKFERYEGRVRFDAIGSELVPRSIDGRSKPSNSAASPLMNAPKSASGNAGSGSIVAEILYDERKSPTSTASKTHSNTSVQPLALKEANRQEAARKEATRKEGGSSKS
ncbi:MAG: MotA/TolQ/ExbB proton channel family protein [Planctomycetota bacterium]|nr:MotA/TolQ/ExbB proton channel family protein [Planctomycetota bacterium]